MCTAGRVDSGKFVMQKGKKVILNRLLDKYENSKHLFEPNTSRRRVMLRITKKEFPEYDYEDAEVRDAYNLAAEELEKEALISLEWARRGLQLSAVILNLEAVEQAYSFVCRVHPRKQAEHVARLVTKELSDAKSEWILAWRDAVCEDAHQRMKLPAFCKDSDAALCDLLTSFRQYDAVSAGTSMRAFSTRCFHDTKYFERNVRENFLRIARKFCSDLSEACRDEQLGEREQLAILGIYARPELYELSGDFAIRTRGGSIDVAASQPYGIGIPSTLVDEVLDFDLKKIDTITFIENKTNYDEYILSEKQSRELVVYHGGFLSPQRRKFFGMLASSASACGNGGGCREGGQCAGKSRTIRMRFWADIDLGGFRMFQKLSELAPGLSPMRMSARDVEKYHKNGLARPEAYLQELQNEMRAGKYAEFSAAIEKILEYGVTIEQEVFLLEKNAAG